MNRNYVVSDETMLDLASCSIPTNRAPNEIFTVNSFGVQKEVLLYDRDLVGDDFSLITRRSARQAMGRQPGGVVMSWYDRERPTDQQVSDVYPGFNNQANAEIGHEIFGRTFEDRGELSRVLVEANGRRTSLMNLCANRFMHGNRFVSANFVRGWLAGAFDVSPNIGNDNYTYEHHCETCVCTKLKNVFECHMELSGNFLKVNMYVGDAGEHVVGLKSMLEAELKYSGKVLELGHLYTVDIDDVTFTGTLDFIRVFRCAHRCIRDYYLNVPEQLRDDHNAIFDHVVHAVDWTDRSEGEIYKLLNCRHITDVATLPPRNMLKEMLKKSRVWYPIE